LLAGVAAVIASLPKRTPNGTPSDPQPGRKLRAETFAAWSLGYGACALLLAGWFVALVGLTTTSLSSVPVRILVSGAAMLAVLGLGCGALNFQQSIAAESGAVRPWRASAGLAVSMGTLAALLIAGT